MARLVQCNQCSEKKPPDQFSKSSLQTGAWRVCRVCKVATTKNSRRGSITRSIVGTLVQMMTTGRGLSIPEIAQRIDRSTKTVRRNIAALEQCGVPIMEYPAEYRKARKYRVMPGWAEKFR